MMGARVALCIDEATCCNPAIMGLQDEAIELQTWLAVYTSGDEARCGIGADEAIEEAWVVSCEDVEPINLAATLKADRPDLPVVLVAGESCGSLFSRAHTALIDEVMDDAQFLNRYAEKKRAFAPLPAAVVSDKPSAVSTVNAGRAFLMPVVSGSGGAGKSSVATMGALIAQSRGYRTLLLDYDLQFGDVAGMVGVEGALGIDEAMAHSDRLERALQASQGLVVLAAPARLEDAENVVKAMPQLLDKISGSFEVIIANTGAAWAEQHAALLERCSTALFLVDQRASSVRACRHALELCARCGIASGPFQFAVNRCAKNAPLTSSDVSCALQGAPVFELREGGRDVEDYLGGGAAAELLESRNEFCTSLAHVMTQLLPEGARRVGCQVEDEAGRSSSWKLGFRGGRKRGRGVS